MNNICKFCGQAMILDDSDLHGQEAVEAATMLCGCEEAKEYRWRKQKIEAAKKTIKREFDDFDGDVAELIYSVSVMVYDEGIKKGTLELNPKCKVSIKKVTTKGKNNIKIERTDKEISSSEV